MLKTSAVLILVLLAPFLSWGNSELFREKIEGRSDYFGQKEVSQARADLNEEKVVQVFKNTLDNDLKPILNSDAAENMQFRVFISKLRENLIKEGAFPKKSKINDKDFKKALVLARENRVIDDVVFYLASKKQAISLARYVALREAFAGVESPVLPKDSENPLTKRVYKESYKGGGTVSPRLRLYFSFNPDQIQSMAWLLEICMGRIAASGAKIVFKYDKPEDCPWCKDGVDEIKLAPTEKYKASLDLFEQMFEEAKTSFPLLNSNAKFIDVVSSAYEINSLSAQKIQVVTNFEGLADPRLSTWQKVSTITYRIGRMALLGMPATQAYAIVPILLLESIHASKKPTGHAGRLFR